MFIRLFLFFILFLNLFSVYDGTIVMGNFDTTPGSVFKVTFADYEKYLPYIYSTEARKLEQTEE